MDVSIKSSDKQAREAFIKARDAKQEAQDLRKKERKDRQTEKLTAVTTKRLRKRIFKEVRSHLLTEKRNYLRGEATGGEYVIDTKVNYRERKNIRYRRLFVESILNEALAQHTGFDFKVDFKTALGEDAWCNSISIWYTLLEQ